MCQPAGVEMVGGGVCNVSNFSTSFNFKKAKLQAKLKDNNNSFIFGLFFQGMLEKFIRPKLRPVTKLHSPQHSQNLTYIK